ncbi:hypothetical protein AnigIFM59636_005666 [Aspergillus niger]|uniref:Contig An02c0310, genomic contig n=3 Tax=Aspergillus niger TaxID=5061 RepID=A5AAD1_ASPNC|nr:uncharacterized protein BO96DRAFT_329431 [Aspergillus niger CBS 101883]XP_059603468.1 uncharacterized protein An02g10250 [Aspergillus niger]RDH23069.1 hypothetical protein M747DRAFT_162547 [Aspergillus niger ATCC 13496]PYH59800.1 hypothetical protein BO96DRAFT_329431 [Aspergillus niger CBS 101883]CAK44373.1 unnamed protein product [Aspergillus niger]GJP91676.1 glycosyl transferase 90 family protein [Aspergillus niger]GKZ87751.1 hypothetical protein AnigIFM59636_005666 [Aspergillus niger]
MEVGNPRAVTPISWGQRSQYIRSRGHKLSFRKDKAQRAEGDVRGSRVVDRVPSLDRVESESVSQRNRDSQTAPVFDRQKRRSASSSTTSSSANSRTITSGDSKIQDAASDSGTTESVVTRKSNKRGVRKQHPENQKKKQKQQQQLLPPPTIRIQDDRFDRVLLIKPRQEALNYAKEVTETSPDDYHVFWVDGSTAANEAAPSGVAVIHGHSGRDADELYCVDEIRISQLAELFAIGAGLRAAVRQLGRLQVSGHVVQFFTDCQAAMEMLRPGAKRLSPLAGRLVRLVDALSHRLCSMGVKVELHWVPGHQCVLGHKRADLLSRVVTKFMMNNLDDKIDQINAVRVDCTYLELS